MSFSLPFSPNLEERIFEGVLMRGKRSEEYLMGIEPKMQLGLPPLSISHHVHLTSLFFYFFMNKY